MFMKDHEITKELFNNYHSLRNLAAATMRELMEVKGMINETSLRIVGYFELALRRNEENKDAF